MYSTGNLKRLLTVSFMAVAMCAATVCRAQQSNLELLELKTTLEASARLIAELQSKLATQKSQIIALSESLSSANAQTTQAREGYEKLKGILEGLGVGLIEGNTDQVRERLVSALADLRLVDEQKKSLSQLLVNLSETSLAYAKASPSANIEASKKLEDAIGEAEAGIRHAESSGAKEIAKLDLHNAKVISMKSELGVAILNVGAKDGVRIGMPFQVIRDDRSVAKILVVDVRKSTSGAVIQTVLNANDPIQVGDRGIVDAERSF